MKIGGLFVSRPVGTTLMTLGVALAGIVAYFLLPIAPLPRIDYPTIAVSASLPGASPETMAATVATPLERQLGGIAGVTEMTSTSTPGNTRVTVQFDLSRDIDGAARDVQAAINASRALLPADLPANPSYRKVNPAEAPVLVVALTSDTLDRDKMYDAASTVLAQRLAQVDGIGQVVVGGGALPAVRIELDPGRLAANGISLDDVRLAVTATNANRPKGAVEDDEHYWQIGANDQAVRAADYAPAVLRYRNGAAVRLHDVADVVDSVQDVRNYGLSNGRPAVLLILYKAPGANIVQTVDRVRALLPTLHASIPAAIDMNVVVDRTPTIRASIREIERALLIAIGLVIVVVYAFLRDARAAALPVVAVPVSLAGTFAIMYLAGMSIDNLSLMAMTVATGFVVDDAIVVLENITRYIERGSSPLQAALSGTREIAFTVISISLSLIAVFIPILFMDGIVGRLFREFALVLSIAIVVSMIVSLTTTPMMSAQLLAPRPRRHARRSEAHVIGRALAALQHGYRRTLRWALRSQPAVLLILAAVIVLNMYLYRVVPKGFFPQQDTGRIVGVLRADQSSSFQLMQHKLDSFASIVRADPGVENVIGFTGGSQRNSATMFISLKPRDVRQVSADQVVARLRERLAHLSGASLYLVPVQDIRVGGRQSNAQYQYTLQADDLAELSAWEPRIRSALTRLPGLVDVNTDLQNRGLQASLTIDRDAAARLGVTMRNIDSTLNDAFGQRQIGVIYHPLNQYRVVMELNADHLQSPESLKDLYVKSGNGAQVSLDSMARTQTTIAPLSINHQDGAPAATISFNLQPGVSLSQAIDAIHGAMAELRVPPSIRSSFQGTASTFRDSLASQPLLILAAIVAVYLILGVLYESLIHPITILSTLPSAGVGALLALMLFRTEFTVIALIGVILLIGIVKKNAIMMIDFALARQRGALQRSSHLGAGAAIYRACVLRVRPILMTTVVAILGAVPLVVGAGDGAELRQPLGIAIVGGLLSSQLLTLYTTPVVFVCMDRLRRRKTLPAGRTPRDSF
jgi:multidrug efflux pump